MTELPNPWIINSAELPTPADTAVVSELSPPGATAVPYSPEPFSEYAMRRCSEIVSPSIEPKHEEPREWPRGFDPERFVCDIAGGTPHRVTRKASPALLRVLFELAGAER